MNTSIDTTLLDGLIVGRVDPHIYAFSTGTIPAHPTNPVEGCADANPKLLLNDT